MPTLYTITRQDSTRLEEHRARFDQVRQQDQGVSTHGRSNFLTGKQMSAPPGTTQAERLTN
jgi:hypothetical protein